MQYLTKFTGPVIKYPLVLGISPFMKYPYPSPTNAWIYL